MAGQPYGLLCTHQVGECALRAHQLDALFEPFITSNVGLSPHLTMIKIFLQPAAHTHLPVPMCRSHVQAAAKPLIRAVVQAVYAHVLYGNQLAAKAAAEAAPPQQSSSERLASPALPQQVEALRSTKKVLMAMEVRALPTGCGVASLQCTLMYEQMPAMQCASSRS